MLVEIGDPLFGVELHADFKVGRHSRLCFAAGAAMRNPLRLRMPTAVPKPRQ
jgi:hypothetical protein